MEIVSSGTTPESRHKELFDLRDKANKGIEEYQGLSFGTKTLLTVLNNLTAAFVVDEGKGLTAGIAYELVPFVRFYYSGKVGKDVVIGHITAVKDMSDQYSYEFTRVSDAQ